MSWWVFAVIGLFTLFISVLIVSWQSWRAGGINPVKALRNECYGFATKRSPRCGFIGHKYSCL